MSGAGQAGGENDRGGVVNLKVLLSRRTRMLSRAVEDFGEGGATLAWLTYPAC